jgi:hypothetical protein
MPRFVRLEDLVSAMAKHTPPGWAKHTLWGAIVSEKISVFAAKGSILAYIPASALEDPKPGLPRLKRAGLYRQIIESHGLTADNVEEHSLIIWRDEWEGEPRQLALGWSLFHGPLDWPCPSIALDHFDVPEDFEEMFGHDDIYEDGGPNPLILHDVRFEQLCVELSQAEHLVPMENLHDVSIGGAGQLQLRAFGRPAGTGYLAADEPLVRQMMGELSEDPTLSLRELARRYADQAVGGGTFESRMKRLERRLRAEL